MELGPRLSLCLRGSGIEALHAGRSHLQLPHRNPHPTKPVEGYMRKHRQHTEMGLMCLKSARNVSCHSVFLYPFHSVQGLAQRRSMNERASE